MWSFFSRDPSRDFNYEIGNPIDGPYTENSLWKLHSGKRKGTGEPVSVFIFDVKQGSETQLEVVKGSVKRLKTLRHPNIAVYLDSLETDKVIYLVTEYVEPLANHLEEIKSNEKQKELEISWGLHQVTKGLQFLINDCSLIHNNVCIWSILKNQAGEWKISGLEYMCPFAESMSSPIKILTQLEKYNPPEIGDPNRKRAIKKWSADMWGLGCLIWEVFNGPASSAACFKNVGKIPKSLCSHYCELVSANPSSRPNPSEFLLKGRSPGGFFSNSFINTLLFLEEIQIKDINEKTKFFNGLTAQLDSFPSEICKYKILPQLITAYEFGNAGSAVLSPLFKLGKLLETEEYQKKIVPCVVKLFSSTDRATRARLLQQMENFVGYLQPSIINDQIFPKIIQGFLDTNPTIRENTVKAMLHLAPKLNYNNINIELMKHFAHLQAKDEQGGIRTNTTVCLGKIAAYLHPQIRQKLLISAFTRAMRDPFPPAKTAGILAFAATQVYYPLSDIACKILPALCCACVDPDKSVRDQAFKTIKGFLGKLEKVSEDPSLASSMEAEVNSIVSPTMADTAASWAGWAVTSLTSKFYKSDKNKSELNTSEVPAKIASLTPAIPSESKAPTPKLDLVQDKQYSTSTDSDDDWNDDWGQLDNKDEEQASSRGNAFLSPSPNENYVWGDEDWSSLDKVTPRKEIPSNQNIATSLKNSSESWSAWDDSEFVSTDANLPKASTYNWEKQDNPGATFFDNLLDKVGNVSSKSSDDCSPQTGWEVDDEWDTVENKPSKNLREERRIQRHKELQEKRSARQATGAMKLGQKKLHPM